MDSIEIRYTGELQRIKPEPGEVFVLSVDAVIDSATAHMLKKSLCEQLGTDRVIVMGKDLKLTTARPGD